MTVLPVGAWLWQFIYKHALCKMIRKERYSLLELNSMVRQTIEDGMGGEYWVEAEVAEMHINRGHCYMQLVQKEENTNTAVAQARAICWRGSWNLISAYFLRVVGQPLRTGMKVLFQVYARFHESFGFSWIVSDINPEYSLGDLARRRQEILRQLKAEGVLDMQKQLRLPLFAQRVAVVSSSTAAGFGDFCNQLASNSYHFQFHVELFAATMQGEQVEQSVIAALDAIYSRADEFDVVVIIRGGGTTADMSGFDTLPLAEAVANFPLPIITGIGHERDECVLDIVAYQRVKTPTAAAAFLIDHLAEVDGRIDEARSAMARAVTQRVQLEKSRLARLQSLIPQLVLNYTLAEQRRIDRRMQSIRSYMERQLHAADNRLSLLWQRMAQASQMTLTRNRHALDLLDQRTRSLDPKLLLSRGYSLTLHEGRIVRSAKSLIPGDKITTTFADGSVGSTVDYSAT